MPGIKNKTRQPSVYQEMLRDIQSLKKKIEHGSPIVVYRVSKEGGRMIIRKQRVSASEYFKRKPSAETITPLSAKEVKQLRDDLALSQSAFAHWLSASPGTVRLWEQKTGVKTGPALRLLQLLRSDTTSWRKRIHREIVGV